MANLIFDKTSKGRAEIATRQYHLAPRLRTMLLLFDGKNSSDQVLQKVAGLGLDAAGIADLLEQEFIHEIGGSPAAIVPVVDPVAVAQNSVPPEMPIPDPLPPEFEPVIKVEPVVDRQFQAVYQFFHETIKNTIGLRGYALQVEVESAKTMDDFRALRDGYVAAVLNTHGPEVARNMSERLDLLLQSKT